MTEGGWTQGIVLHLIDIYIHPFPRLPVVQWSGCRTEDRDVISPNLPAVPLATVRSGSLPKASPSHAMSIHVVREVK